MREPVKIPGIPLRRCSKLLSHSKGVGRATWAQRAKSTQICLTSKWAVQQKCEEMHQWHLFCSYAFLTELPPFLGLKWILRCEQSKIIQEAILQCHHLPLCRPSLVTTTLVVMGFVLASETESDVVMILGVEDKTSRHMVYANHLSNRERLPFQFSICRFPQLRGFRMFHWYPKCMGHVNGTLTTAVCSVQYIVLSLLSEASVYRDRHAWLKQLQWFWPKTTPCHPRLLFLAMGASFQARQIGSEAKCTMPVKLAIRV